LQQSVKKPTSLFFKNSYPFYEQPLYPVWLFLASIAFSGQGSDFWYIFTPFV